MVRTWTDALNKPIDCIHRDSCELVGMTHLNKRGLSRLPLIDNLRIGDKLILVPDPANEHDRNAILVYGEGDRDNDLGFVHRMKAKQICPLIERGAVFTAQLYWIDRQKPDYPKPYIYLFKWQEPTLRRRPGRA